VFDIAVMLAVAVAAAQVSYAVNYAENIHISATCNLHVTTAKF